MVYMAFLHITECAALTQIARAKVVDRVLTSRPKSWHI